ncbi:MAG: glycosyltransferase family 4 protein [Candidatus Stygibacter australis]|nr:glycosyltransferase family 4 protein [Candidatus Stygibacter australis]MDP8321123.1 glycosyltransferase family 4 protein [Candidatus Stygibacter australis]
MDKKNNYRIGMVLDDRFPPDGRVEKEIRSLTSAGFTVFLLCFRFGDENEESDFYGAKIIRIRINRKLSRKLRALTNTIFDIYTAYWCRNMVEFVKKYNLEILHIHDLYLVGAALKAKKKLGNGVKVCGDLHENYADALKYYKFSNTFPGNILISVKKWQLTEKKWLSQLDRAVVVVEEMKNRIAGDIASEQVFVCENCPEIVSFQGEKNDNKIIEKYKDKFVLSYIGAFDWHRGIDTLLRAISELKTIENLVVCIVGTGKIALELEALAVKLGIREKVYFEGWQPPDILPDYFRISNIGIIPHKKSVQTDNSSPNKLYQYMYYEVPVIATNCMSLERILKETGAGLIYQSDNHQDLTIQIKKLFNDVELRENMKLKGKRAIIEKYNWETSSEGLVKMYNDLSITSKIKVEN